MELYASSAGTTELLHQQVRASQTLGKVDWRSSPLEFSDVNCSYNDSQWHLTEAWQTFERTPDR